MSVESLGRDLLGEVKEEGLDEVRSLSFIRYHLLLSQADHSFQLLHSLRELETPWGPSLGFPPLDRLLDVFRNPPPTRQQQRYQYAHVQWPTHEHALPPTREKPLPVVEITGATACSGKTQLLYYLISLSLLPANYKNLAFGQEKVVVLFDLSSRFSILRLHDIINHHISSVCALDSIDLDDQELSSLISDSLTHLHVFRPQSSSSLLATLASLSPYLLSEPSSHFSTNRPLGLLAISDISAFLWQDRQDADEEAGLPTTTNHAEKANNSLVIQRYRNIVNTLRSIQHRFSCTIIATNWGMASISPMAGHRALRPSLPSVWSQFCTVKVVIERDQVPKFGPGISAEEALKEGPQRWEAVEKSGFCGWLNWWDSEGWREEVREALRGLEGGGSFSFRVTQQGLEIRTDDG